MIITASVVAVKAREYCGSGDGYSGFGNGRDNLRGSGFAIFGDQSSGFEAMEGWTLSPVVVEAAPLPTLRAR